MIDSDEEADIDDIKRAQKLSFSMTNIVNSPEAHRSVRVIYRGEYNKIAQAAEEEHRRLRKYLVATDVSEESTHALEWAIGTVLRDGDTLVAIYCVDEETGIDTGDQSSLPDDAKKQAAAVNSITSAKIGAGPTTPVSEFISKSAFHRRGDSSGTPAASPAPSGRYDKAEEERQHAVRDITDRVLRLLRKTQLQVRVVVEVLHCKNPKHLITEVIDLVSPTLVVIGSRGRSALKG
jgi:nucleotide-binding universal stress UspA family protein